MQSFLVRPAGAADGEAIAAAHIDSIRTLGAQAYSEDVVADWGAPRTGERYRDAMSRGVLFFVAVPASGGNAGSVLGFSSYAVEGDMHRTAVYVRAHAARQGVGRALFGAVEGAARESGAPVLTIEAALGAIPFWTAMGFESVAPTDHVTRGGHLMPSLLMRKPLRKGGTAV